jgi:UDP-glucose 4-epimerase
MKAAIVGAAGFLGHALCGQLVNSGWEVVGYDLTAPRPAHPGLVQETLDVLRDEIVFPPGTDAVYYLAQSPLYRDFPRSADHLFGVNAYGAIKAARAAHAAGVRWFCYTSTGNVYAPSLAPLAEHNPVRRDDPYALSKLAAEEALGLIDGPMSVLAVRLFGLYGPGQTRMLPANLLERIRTGKDVVLEPTADQPGEPEGLVLSFTYVADAARLLDQLGRLAVAGTPLPPILNVAAPEPISIRRFAAQIGEILGLKPKFCRASTFRSHNLIADVGLLRSILEPEYVPFAEAMARTYAPAPAEVSHRS